MGVHHRKTVVILLGLAAVTLLSLWRAHSRLSRALPVKGGYDESLLEVRQYNSEDGWFEVVFNRVRDVKTANTVLVARANQTNHLEKSSINIQLKEVGKIHPLQYINQEINRESPYQLRQLTYSTEQKRVLESKQRRKNTYGNVISPFLHSLPASKRLDALAQSDGLPAWTPSGNLTKQVVGDHQYKPLSMEQHSSREQWQVGIPRPPPPPFPSQPALQEQTNYVDRIQNPPHVVGENYLKVLEPFRSDLKQVLSTKHVENVGLAHTTQQFSKLTQFPVKSYMSWPLPLYTRADILQSQWAKDLKQYLSGIGSFNQISIVTANQEHMEVVLNWLVSAIIVAKLPLENILVLSLSLKLHELLVSKKINSIYVPSTSVISKSGLKQIRTAFNQIHIVRLTFFRLINHWGYDVVMYDSDAVLLRDPQPLFDAHPLVELVGSAGRGPENIGRVWGRTICTGVLLMRSSQNIELWWEKMSKVSHLPFTDQGLVNIALKALKVKWQLSSVIRNNMDMQGTCESSKLQAVILSEEKICRYRCDSSKRSQYYVWHKPAIKRNRTVEKKKARAREGGAWFLKDDWSEQLKKSYTDFNAIMALSNQPYS